MPSTFHEEIAVRAIPGSPGRYMAVFGHDWFGPRAPQGGVVAACALHAMAAALADPDQRLRTSTTVFATRVPAGPVDIDVEVVRRGRGVSQMQGAIRAAGEGSGGHVTLGVFGRRRTGWEHIEFAELRPPAAPPPEECAPPPAERPEPSILDASLWERLEVADVAYRYPWDGDWKGGRALGVRWVRYRDTPRTAEGAVDPLAYLPLVDAIPGAVAQWLGPGRSRYAAPTLDLTVHFLDETEHEWIMQVMRIRRAAHGYASGEMELWSRDNRLLAHASQTMMFADPTG